MYPLALLLLAAPHIGGKVAVMDVKASDVRESLAPLLTEVLTTEVSASGVFDHVIAGRDVAAMLSFEEQRQVLGCDDASCLAELGGALGVDRLIVPQVGRVADAYLVTIKLIDIRHATTDQRVYETVEGREDELFASVRRSAAKLLGVEPSRVVQRSTLEREPSSALVLPIVLLAAGAASAGVGIALGLKAKGHADRAADPGFLGAQREIQKSRSTALASNVAYGVGGALAIGGVIAWLVGDTSGTSGAAVVHADGAIAFVQGRF